MRSERIWGIWVLTSEWKEFLLGEILEDYIRGPFGSSLKRGEMQEEGIPIYEQQNAIYDHRKFRYYINDEKFEVMKRFKVQENDLIISCSGTIGKVSIIKENDPVGIISQALLILRPNTSLAIPEFLYYYFSSHYGYYDLTSVSSGSVQVNVANRKIIEKTKIRLPPISKQIVIVNKLSSIDGMLSNQKKSINTTEQLISVLFRSWFIDFDPVKAKSEGKLPFGMDEETAALFPDSFVDSELGPIPTGWELCSILELGDFLNGVASQKYPVTNEDDSLPVVKIREMQSGVTEKSDWASTSTPQKYHINEGEILFSWAATLLVQHWQGNKAILNQHIFKVTPSENFPEWFVYQYLTSELWKFQRMATAGETMMGHIKRKDLQQHFIVIPPNQLLKKLSETMNPLYSLSKSISINQKHITSIRDALLPKLMSGELKVN